MKKLKKRIILFILFLFLIPFLSAFEPKLYITVNTQFNFQIFLKVLFLLNLGPLLVIACFGQKKD